MKGLWLVEILMRQVAIIRCKAHQVTGIYRLGGHLSTMSHFIDVH